MSIGSGSDKQGSGSDKRGSGSVKVNRVLLDPKNRTLDLTTVFWIRETGFWIRPDPDLYPWQERLPTDLLHGRHCPGCRELDPHPLGPCALCNLELKKINFLIKQL